LSIVLDGFSHREVTGRSREQEHCLALQVQEGAFGHGRVGQEKLLQDHVAHYRCGKEIHKALPEENEGCQVVDGNHILLRACEHTKHCQSIRVTHEVDEELHEDYGKEA